MHVLLSPFSLPQRLLNKAFYQPALGILAVALLAIWTIGNLLESRAAPVEFTTTSLSAETVWKVDVDSLRATAGSFVRSQREHIHDSVIEYLDRSVYRDCRDAISSWNRSLSTSIHAQKIMYGYMLGLNRTITDVLYNESKKFNESLEGMGILNVKQLSPNYWFIGELFEDAATNNTKLNDLKLNFPLISNFGALRLPNISTDSFVSKVHEISNRWPEENSAIARVKENKFPIDLKPHCRVLTVIMVMTYLLCTVAMCIYEWLKYRWETLIFNRHVDLHLHPLEKDEEEGPIRSQQRSYQFCRQLVFTMSNTPLYWISNWMGARKTKEGTGWSRFVSLQWWVLANTGYFFLILIAVIIHWQIYVSLIHNYSNQLTTFENPNKNLTRNITKSITNGTKFYDDFTQECHNFELNVLRILNTSLFDQLWSSNGSVVRTLDNVNKQMNNLVKAVHVASPPEWNNLTLSKFAYPSLSINVPNNDSTSDSLILRCLKDKAVSRRQTAISSIINTDTFYSSNPRQGPLETGLHKWFIMGVVVNTAVLYLIGLGIFTRI